MDNPRRRPILKWFYVGAIGLATVLGCQLYLFFNPYDEVHVAIRGLPPDTEFAYLVASRSDGDAVMPWSIHKVITDQMHPDGCTISEVTKGESEKVAAVRWVNSERVGILRKAGDGKWSVDWFDGPKSSPQGRSVLFGGGRWKGNWADARGIEEWSDAKLRSLGFSYFLERH